MLIAQQKRNENIIEYLIYMFQVEDMVRACKLDINLVDEMIISKYDHEYSVKRDIREWYNAIIQMMKESGRTRTGHIPLLDTLVADLNEIHHQIKDDPKRSEYAELYKEAKPAIEELTLKSGHGNEISVCLNGLYGYLLLKISSRDINPDTVTAMNQISAFLGMLSEEFHRIEKGEQEL